MMRSPWLICALLFAIGLANTVTRGQLSEEEKKQMFLKARERMRTVPSPTPLESATPRRNPTP
jgi:hypothetical protein